MSHISQGKEGQHKEPNLSKIESQGPVSDSKFYGESAFDYIPASKRQKPIPENAQEQQRKSSHQVQVSKNKSENPINLSQFKDEAAFDSSKVQVKEEIKEEEKSVGKSRQSSALKKQYEEEYNPYTPEGDSYVKPQKQKVKSVESQEVVNVNTQNSVSEKIASGIVIRIKSLQKIYGFVPEKIYIEIRNQTNMNAEERQSSAENARKTRVVSRKDPVWDQDFYYNNSVILDDNITFVLRAENGKQIARRQERNLSKIKMNLEEEGQILIQRLKLQLRRKDEDNSEEHVGDLLIELSFYEREDILGGVVMPNLSLKPGEGFVGKYNAVEKYKPNFTNKVGSKANCFNFFDGQTIPGFDTIEVFPPKFVKKNKHKKVVAAQ